jgi:heme-degrading monooxygenase HmoA
MGELATAQPGFVDYKSFAAPDGETVTISVWESAAAARGRHPNIWRRRARAARLLRRIHDVCVR